jgi:hypothetical protein
MIRAQLRYLHSPDVYDLESFVPEDAKSFGFLLEAMIGPERECGEESFDIVVCSPKWLHARMREDQESYRFGRHYLFLLRYDYAVLRQAIQGLIDSAVGEDWGAVAARLGRYGKWEFEDYVPYDPDNIS